MDRNKSLHTAAVAVIYAAGIAASILCAFAFSLPPSDAGSQADNQPANPPVIVGLSATNPVIFPMGATGRW
ncbi:MAG: hypothetical protein ABWY00_12035 [Dongiaceae bacterium]